MGKTGGGTARAWLQARPAVWDRINAASLFFVGAVVLAITEAGPQPDGTTPWWSHLLPLALGSLNSLFRRRHSFLGLAVGLAAVGWDAALGGSVCAVLVLLDLLYNSAKYGGLRLRRLVFGLSGALVLLVGLKDVSGGDLIDGVRSALQAGALLGTPLWWATNVRQREEIAAVAEQRLKLEREHAADRLRISDLNRQEAIQTERSRMAGDLHDAVASRLSAIAIHSAAALAVSPGDPRAAERDRAALAAVRTASTEALEDMRSMITVLRSDSIAERPSPSLAGADNLLDQARAVGLEVTLEGNAPAQLPTAVDQALYRILQEGLANAAKHAPGSQARISFRKEPEWIELELENTPGTRRNNHHALGARLAAPFGTGVGLDIMAERARALDGTLVAGSTDDGGWRVTARIPSKTSTSANEKVDA